MRLDASLAARAGMLVLVVATTVVGCRRSGPSRRDDVRGRQADTYDYGPSFSRSGERIAFMRQRGARTWLCIADSRLTGCRAVADAGEVNPDRRPRIGVTGWTGEERPVWGPSDQYVVYPRCVWVKTASGAQAPGTVLWSYSLVAARSTPFAISGRAEDDGEEAHVCFFRSPAIREDARFAALVAERPGPATSLILRPLGMRPPDAGELRPDDFAQADWPAWEPGGRRLAFARGVLRGASADRVASVRVIEPGGLTAFEAVRVTARRYRLLCIRDAGRRRGSIPDPWICGVRWSLDGRRIFFTLTGDATDRARYSLWSVEAKAGSALLREDPDDGAGYLAPHPLGHALVGAVRWGSARPHAVLLSGSRRVASSADLPSDDMDWAPDGSSVVVANGKATTAYRAGLEVVRLSRHGGSGLRPGTRPGL